MTTARKSTSSGILIFMETVGLGWLGAIIGLSHVNDAELKAIKENGLSAKFIAEGQEPVDISLYHKGTKK